MPPVNEALIAVMRATRSETKELQKENEAKIEKDFVVNNWQFFAEVTLRGINISFI